MVGVVRPAEALDARAIAEVHVASWRSTYRGMLPDDFLQSLSVDDYEDRWRRTLNAGWARVFVAATGRDVVGFASGGRERAGEAGYAGELYAIYVVREAQGQGHGKRLVQALVRALQEMDLADMIVWVLRDNVEARKFYERLGGVYVRTQPITIGPVQLQEVSYGWRSLDDLRY